MDQRHSQLLVRYCIRSLRYGPDRDIFISSQHHVGKGMRVASFVQGCRYHLDLISYRLGPQKNYKLILHEQSSPYDNEPINCKDHSLLSNLSIPLPTHTFEYH